MVVEIHNGATAKRVTDRLLNGVMGRSIAWYGDSKSLVANLVPLGRGVAPRFTTASSGPAIQENLGKRNPVRTYQDLLRSRHDEALFEYYASGELANVALDGKVTPLASGMIRAFQPSPDGEYVMVQTVRRPFSYSVPVAQFPLRTEIRDAREVDVGRSVKVLSELTLSDDDEPDPDAVRKGPRQYGWRGDSPATITWLQQIDGRRNGLGDQLFSLAAPFDTDAQLLARMDLRFQSIFWGRDDAAILVEAARKTRRTIVWRIFPGENTGARAPVKLFDRLTEDRYGDPGVPLTETSPRGTRVLNFTPDGKAMYLIGNGASPDGDRPFIDRFDVESRETRRLYRSESPYYDVPMALFDADGNSRLLMQRESATEPPNVYLRDLVTGTFQAVTRFTSPRNPIANATREVIRYKRRDGVELSATLYLPLGYKKSDDPPPMIMWAYPREFRSTEAASQVLASPFRYSRPSFNGALPFLNLGYAVLDNPQMPIIADSGREPNDVYLPQLIASAEAAVDEVVRRGVAERGKIAIGGHSYGAFMVANLLAHTRLFAAGVAESGAYNRSLTPFGFQSEERNFWKAREVYNQMSPFNFADRIKAPLLLMHGEADSDAGTFPLQSERLYQAIRGLGGTARIVMLPYEDHNYRGRESVLHRLWEIQRWLDRYVKNAGKTP
jgi:dipeptidyl aminopeptidase/acylaminoacyl peptidase